MSPAYREAITAMAVDDYPLVEDHAKAIMEDAQALLDLAQKAKSMANARVAGHLLAPTAEVLILERMDGNMKNLTVMIGNLLTWACHARFDAAEQRVKQEALDAAG